MRLRILSIFAMSIALIAGEAQAQTATGQDIVFNMTGVFAVRPPTADIPSPDINGYDRANFEFEAVFEEGLETSRSSFTGPFVFEAQSATLTITGAGEGNNGTFTPIPTEPALYRPSSGDFGRSLGPGLAPVRFNETEIALRVSAGLTNDGIRPIGGLVDPIFPLTSNVISIDQFGSPNPSPIIFSDFAMNFDPTVQSDYGVVDLVITVTGPSCILGDVDMNGVVDFNDIPEFVTVLLGNMFQCEADVDQNDLVDFNDIPLFVEILLGSGSGS